MNAKEINGYTALMSAARGGYDDIVRALLAAGADVSAGTSDGDTALTIAERAGKMATAKLLEDAGAPK